MTDTSVPQIPLRRCTKCGEEKPATREYFYAAENRLRGDCKACVLEQQSAYRREHPEQKRTASRVYYLKNQEKRKADARRWRQEHPKEVIAYRRKYQLEHPDKNAARAHAHYLIHQERYRENARAHFQRRKAETKEQRNAAARAYYARKKGAIGSHTAEDVKLIFNSQRGCCWWCGCQLGDKYHVDHRIPIMRGGSNAPENLCVTCPPCNLSKHDRLPQEWNGRLL